MASKRKQAAVLAEKKTQEARGRGKRSNNKEEVSECFRKRKKNVFNFLNEGQNDPFNKLLGAPTILLGAPSISPIFLDLLTHKENYNWIKNLVPIGKNVKPNHLSVK